MITMILGGARSGKSTYAESLIHSNSTTYIATAIAFDEGMKHRIRMHQSSRPSEWTTLEQYKGFSEPITSEYVLLDCLTLMISNLLMESCDNFDRVSPEELMEIENNIKQEIDGLLHCCKDTKLIVVSNEVGLGLASPYSMGNAFRDIAGRMNQYIAKKADKVIFMISGLPMVVKE